MKLQKAPILHLFKLEVDPKNHDKLIQSMLDAHLDQNALFMQSGFQDDTQYQKRLNSEEYQAFLKASDKLLTEKVDVELQPEFISTKPDKLNVSGENDYVVYMTEIGVQLGKGDEFANGVLKEMKAAVEKEVGIMVMIAGTVMNQPNEWLSLEVYQNKDAYQKHLETKHFKRYLEATKFCVESKGLHLLKSDFVSDQGQIFYRP